MSHYLQVWIQKEPLQIKWSALSQKTDIVSPALEIPAYQGAQILPALQSTM